VVSKYEGQIKDIRKKGEEKMMDNEIKISELKDNLNSMEVWDK